MKSFLNYAHVHFCSLLTISELYSKERGAPAPNYIPVFVGLQAIRHAYIVSELTQAVKGDNFELSELKWVGRAR